MSTKKDLARVSAEAVEVIGSIAEAGIALPLPAEVKTPLAVIMTITKAVQAGIAREIRPEEVTARIEEAIAAMNDRIAANRIADQAELDAVFGPKDPALAPPESMPDLETPDPESTPTE